MFSFGQTYPLKKSVEGDIDFFLPYKRERERERERIHVGIYQFINFLFHLEYFSILLEKWQVAKKAHFFDKGKRKVSDTKIL